ncbi:bacchus [Lucilia cuprina]|uniref:bacchus n=1 Tax=Lucilia cuprina TaxID=7375 RepID=UPI001F05608B|nr:bacchus [Lucilia cuprina]
MSAATEQQNNGDVAVEKVAADAVKDDLKSQKAAVEDSKPAAADNGTASKDEVHDEDAAPAKEQVKGTKRPAEAKNSESKKAKKEKAPDAESDDEEVIDEEGNEGDSDIESDEYDIPYDGEEDDIECEDDDDENDDGSGSDDQA